MNTAVREPRVEAALRCYALVKRCQPGSVQADVAEQAILYALSEGRDVECADDLVRNVLHDGRRSVMRSARSRVGVEQALVHLSAAGIDTAGARAAVGGEMVEHVVLARELLSELRQCARRIGNPAPRVLAGMLIGETEAETARAAGMSRSTITRTRRALRLCAADAGYLPAAA